MRLRIRPLVLSALPLALSVFGGCAPKPITLEKAEVVAMSVDLRQARKTICPRSTLQMAVFVEAKFDGDKASKQLETWKDADDSKKNKVDFAEFAFQSDQGSFDAAGHFSPTHDVLATVDKEFQIKTVYRRRPDKFSFTTTYKPDYSCIEQVGRAGKPGPSGSSGQGGNSGGTGASGTADREGGAGRDGASGGPGGSGGDGGPGPRVVAYATMVKTAYYPRLVAIQIEGDVTDFVLVPEGQPFTISADGGPGGAGGDGGGGGAGGDGGGGNPGGRGGSGAAGGGGGSGGSGGPGGYVEIVYDTRFPELVRQIRPSVQGGAAGAAGNGGGGGGAGAGGSGIGTTGKPTPPSGAKGNAGQHGPSGAQGHAGAPGRSQLKPAVVKDRFETLHGITVL